MNLILKKKKRGLVFHELWLFQEKKSPLSKTKSPPEFFPKVKSLFYVLQKCYETCRTSKLHFYFQISDGNKGKVKLH